VEASVDTPRKLDGEKATRIVAAMRASVAKRGAAGSTFDVVAREAGVSRGLLHYYFGSKERLLVEVVRQDCDARIAALEQALAGADSVDGIVAVLVASLEDFVWGESAEQALVYEMISASHHSEEIRAELGELYRRWRAHLAASLREKEAAGVVRLDADPEAVASVIFALGDGMGLQLSADASWSGSADALALGVATVRRMLGASD
jgi:AcrR family transcriptional regulator